MGNFRKAVQSIGDASEKLGDAGDKLFTSKEEKMELVNQRHENDMHSDSWLSKNIRPLVFLITIATLLGMTISSGLGVVLASEAWVIIRSTIALEVAFYFGGRSLEKISNKFFDRNKQKKGAF